MFGGTVSIDDASDNGAWARAIATTPSLRAQCEPEDYERAARCPLEARGTAGAAAVPIPGTAAAPDTEAGHA